MYIQSKPGHGRWRPGSDRNAGICTAQLRAGVLASPRSVPVPVCRCLCTSTTVTDRTKKPEKKDNVSDIIIIDTSSAQSRAREKLSQAPSFQEFRDTERGQHSVSVGLSSISDSGSANNSKLQEEPGETESIPYVSEGSVSGHGRKGGRKYDIRT